MVSGRDLYYVTGKDEFKKKGTYAARSVQSAVKYGYFDEKCEVA